ncbi:MAG TPA: sigma-70 family RNA polymerase sigma factor [Actinomycetota bacterium]|nr:sigma-70 family RNA polymerase sigma factor [Actinomycetota bacterium]
MDIPELIRSARSGEPYAGPFLVSLFGERLLGYARAIASDLGDADRELVVERAIERAILKIDRFDPAKGSFGSWLRGFVRHAVGDWRRSEGALEELREDLESTPEEEQSAPVDPATVAAVSDVLASLRDTDQLIIALRAIEELPYGEIATRIGGVSEEACRQRYFRALQRFREAADCHPELAAFRERRRS